MLPEAGDATFNDWSLTSLTTLPVWGVVLLGVLLLATLVATARAMRLAPPRVRIPLLVLRTVGLLLAVLLLLEPGLQLQQVSETPGRVAVVLDVSRSMALPAGDGLGGTRMDRARGFLEAVQRALTRLPANITPEAYIFSGDITAATVASLGAQTPAGDRSSLAGAVRHVLEARPGRPLAGVVLLSDGADNVEIPGTTLPAELKEKLTRAGVPFHVVPLGAEQGFKDLWISEVHADDFAFVRNPLEVEATIASRGLGDLAVPVTLKKDGRVLAVGQVEVREDGQAAVTFKFEPREVGEAVYSVEVPQQAGEVLLDNNRRFFTLKVIRDRIRVLQVAGRPSWDVRFLRKLLKENPSVDLISFFILRTPTDVSAVRPEELSLIPFPTRELFTEELSTFDVVVFQNFNFAPYEMGGYLPNVRQFIQGGGGFAMVGGELSFSEGGYDSTVLADMLPVTLPPSRGHYQEETYIPTVTEAGRRHPILSFPGGDAASVIARLPAFEGFNGSLALANNAEALLTHPAPRTGPSNQPVLAVREVGKGRTMALLTDSLWFWALPDAGGGGRGTAHRELWANAIRWLIGDPALSRVRVEAKSAAFDPQEPVVLTVRTFDAAYSPLVGANITLTLDGFGDAPTPDQPGGARRVTQVEGVSGADGEWTARIPSPGPGAYRARVTARMANAALGSDEDAFLVRQADRESSEGAPRPELLAALAAASDGAVVLKPQDVEGLRWKLPEGVRVHKRKTEPLWDRTWVGVLLVAVWGLEWALRRRNGFA